MKRQDDHIHAEIPVPVTLDLSEAARYVRRQMACLGAGYARVDDTRTGHAWSLRDHVVNARLRLERLADAIALDVPVAGLEVEVARSLHERAEILVSLCEQRRDSACTAYLEKTPCDTVNTASGCCLKEI